MSLFLSYHPPTLLVTLVDLARQSSSGLVDSSSTRNDILPERGHLISVYHHTHGSTVYCSRVSDVYLSCPLVCDQVRRRTRSYTSRISRKRRPASGALLGLCTPVELCPVASRIFPVASTIHNFEAAVIAPAVFFSCGIRRERD